jgi:hypothetical protein
MTLNIAVLAPMPRAKVTIATAAKPGVWRLAQATQRITDVIREPLERHPSPHLARHFLDDGDVSELASCSECRLCKWLAPLDAVGNLEPQMRFNLFVEVAVLAAAP